MMSVQFQCLVMRYRNSDFCANKEMCIRLTFKGSWEGISLLLDSWYLGLFLIKHHQSHFLLAEMVSPPGLEHQMLESTEGLWPDL